MTTLGCVYLGLAWVTGVWINKAVAPPQATNAAGWAFGLVATLVLLLTVLGVLVVR